MVRPRLSGLRHSAIPRYSRGSSGRNGEAATERIETPLGGDPPSAAAAVGMVRPRLSGLRRRARLQSRAAVAVSEW